MPEKKNTAKNKLNNSPPYLFIYEYILNLNYLPFLQFVCDFHLIFIKHHILLYNLIFNFLGLITFKDGTHGLPRHEGFFKDCKMIQKKKCPEVINDAQRAAMMARIQAEQT